eukprot:GHVQ01016839.1.p1 GENE.GHVQ01016839.1~~GHVQ01016839.1.p1  ORF type:complete len:746 (+),score=50.48 GHVQ01016839.1:120-2240(+)
MRSSLNEDTKYDGAALDGINSIVGARGRTMPSLPPLTRAGSWKGSQEYFEEHIQEMCSDEGLASNEPHQEAPAEPDDTPPGPLEEFITGKLTGYSLASKYAWEYAPLAVLGVCLLLVGLLIICGMFSCCRRVAAYSTCGYFCKDRQRHDLSTFSKRERLITILVYGVVMGGLLTATIATVCTLSTLHISWMYELVDPAVCTAMRIGYESGFGDAYTRGVSYESDAYLGEWMQPGLGYEPGSEKSFSGWENFVSRLRHLTLLTRPKGKLCWQESTMRQNLLEKHTAEFFSVAAQLTSLAEWISEVEDKLEEIDARYIYRLSNYKDVITSAAANLQQALAHNLDILRQASSKIIGPNSSIRALYDSSRQGYTELAASSRNLMRLARAFSGNYLFVNQVYVDSPAPLVVVSFLALIPLAIVYAILIYVYLDSKRRRQVELNWRSVAMVNATGCSTICVAVLAGLAVLLSAAGFTVTGFGTDSCVVGRRILAGTTRLRDIQHPMLKREFSEPVLDRCISKASSGTVLPNWLRESFIQSIEAIQRDVAELKRKTPTFVNPDLTELTDLVDNCEFAAATFTPDLSNFVDAEKISPRIKFNSPRSDNASWGDDVHSWTTYGRHDLLSYIEEMAVGSNRPLWDIWKRDPRDRKSELIYGGFDLQFEEPIGEQVEADMLPTSVADVMAHLASQDQSRDDVQQALVSYSASKSIEC